jgi:hypothetical protein
MFYSYILHAVKWRLHRLSRELVATLAERELHCFYTERRKLQISGLTALSDKEENGRVHEGQNRKTVFHEWHFYEQQETTVLKGERLYRKVARFAFE